MIDIAKASKWLKMRYDDCQVIFVAIVMVCVLLALPGVIERKREHNGGDTPKGGAL